MIEASPADLTYESTAAEAALAASRLGQMGGAAIAQVLAAEELAELASEAFIVATDAQTAWVPEPLDDERGKGDPERWLDTATGGPALYRYYHDPRIGALLLELTGLAWTTSGEQGSYSFYRNAGHHLGLHRDVDSCEIAVITCVYDDRPPLAGNAGALVLYPTRTADALADIRRSDAVGAIPVFLTPGQSLVLLGGKIPHRLLPVAAGQTRIVAPLCYRVAR